MTAGRVPHGTPIRSLLVVPGSAVLTMQHLKSQFVPPETWLEAAGQPRRRMSSCPPPACAAEARAARAR
ncbi:DUF5949 family protein [Streptomyces collinus]|uniref:DUF5949 family protein n=1 Tax=Streptomyces collinus TaxID=42684 RepID=UPI003658F2A7